MFFARFNSKKKDTLLATGVQFSSALSGEHYISNLSKALVESASFLACFSIYFLNIFLSGLILTHYMQHRECHSSIDSLIPPLIYYVRKQKIPDFSGILTKETINE